MIEPGPACSEARVLNFSPLFGGTVSEANLEVLEVSVHVANQRVNRKILPIERSDVSNISGRSL